MIDVEAKADLALRSGTRGPGGSSSINHEMGKRLDRWATGTTDRPFQGADGNVTLKEWTQAMKDSAGYCAEALQKAMEDVERGTEEAHASSHALPPSRCA